MKQRQIFITLLLVMSLIVSAFTFSSCEVLNGIFGNNGGDDIIDDGSDKEYSVSYESGAEDAVGEAPAATSHKKGSVITIAANPFTREGYNFAGWSYGGKVYAAGDSFTVSKSNVVFVAVWSKIAVDLPETSELPDSFYNADSWEYMTNNDGASLDGGDIPYVMADGSIKFHRANQAIEIGDLTNATVSFMLKATNDFSVWFNSSTKDNANNSSYRLNYAYGQLRIALSSAPEQAAAVIDDSIYVKGGWNRFDIVFSTNDGVCEIKVYINGTRAGLSVGDYTAPAVNVSDDVLTHTQPAMFSTGNYMVVKVWEAHNYVQLKPVAKADENDLPIIACIGASITEGAGAENFYTESYPAQLQNALGGLYNVVNFGNSGKTVNPNLGDESWMNQYQWAGVQAIVPDIAILNIGTNDSKTHNNPNYDDFYTNFKYLVDSLLEVNPEMRIVVCTVPYAYSDIWGISNENIANIIAPVQRDIANEYGLDLIDLYEFSQDKAHLFPDGVHPNTKGYEMFVKIISKAILEGDEALTEEFIASINAEYGPKVPNAYVEVESVVIKDMTLTVTGKTNDEGLLLYVGQGDGKINYTKEITLGDNESFSVSMDLTTLTVSSDWYNVRLYFTDGNYRTISLNELTDGEGGTYGLWSHIPLETTQVQVCSWDEGGVPTLSFSVSEYTKPMNTISVSGGSIVVNGDQILLTVTGNTTDKNAVLLVGPKDDVALYGHALNVADDGSFTITFDLATLTASGDWQNVRLVMADGNNIVVPYDILGVNVDDVFYTSNKKITVKTWGGEKITSLSVENYDASYTLTATEVKFENGKLVFSGVTTNVRTLTAYLYNSKEGNLNFKADAVLNADGSFTVEIDLTQLTIADNEWYYLWTSVNGGDLTKVVYENYDSNEVYMHGFRNYKWAYWEGIAIVYTSTGYKNSITNYSLSEVDGKPVFIIEGYLNDLTIAADTITLRLDKTGGTTQKIDVENLATEAGYFKFVYDLSDLYISEDSTQYKEKAYFVRIFVNGEKHSDINSKWAANQLFAPVNVNGYDYYLMRNNASAYYTLGIVKLEKAAPTPVVNYTGAVLENGKLVLSGTCANISSISVSVYDSNDTSIAVDTIKADAVINSDGTFVAQVDLASVTEGRPWNWYFIMVSVNGADYTNIIVPYDAADSEVVGNRTFSFIDWQGGNTAIQYQ